MFNLVIIGSSLLIIPLGVYGIYGVAVLFQKNKKSSLKLSKLPEITVFFPAWNEEKVIDMKIKNLSSLDYPKEKLKVVIVNDASTDKTRETSIEALKKYGIKGEVITNTERRGTNYNYNLGVKLAKTDFVLTTDADVIFEKKSIKEALKILFQSERIGAVCGELKPVIKKKSIASSTELPYRSVYGKMCSFESDLESSYCFNGPFILLRKKAFSPINEKRGASDASAALQILRNGFETKYVTQAKFSELIATDLKEQKRQKIRRATRLLQCTWDAHELLFKKGWFGMFVFPLRYLMFFIAPSAFFVGVLSFIGLSFLLKLELGILFLGLFILFFIIGKIKENFISSFIWHQYYLLRGLFQMFKPNYLWKPIERRTLK